MTTDVRFLQKYNAVLLENFDAVLKQNFIFQTRIGLLEEEVGKVADYETIKADVSKLITENTDLRAELNFKNLTIQQSSNVDNERHRLQTALNKQSKEIAQLEVKSKDMQKTLEEQTEYIRQLEEMLPSSKKKKIGKQKEVQTTDEVVVAQPDNDTVKVESAGGNF